MSAKTLDLRLVAFPLSKARLLYDSPAEESPNGSDALLHSSVTAVSVLLTSSLVGGAITLLSSRLSVRPEQEEPTGALPSDSYQGPSAIPSSVPTEFEKLRSDSSEVPPVPLQKEGPLSWGKRLSTALDKFQGLFGSPPKASQNVPAPVAPGGPTARSSQASQEKLPSLTSSGLIPLTKPIRGLRSKFEFPLSLRGARSLSQNGRYTQEEALRIVQLKESGKNTGASSTMPEEVYNYIHTRAPAYGLDPNEMVTVAALESGGNPDAVSQTGAIGVFQFTSAAASDYGVHNRFDFKANIEGGLKMAFNNKKRLGRSGISSGALSTYLAHQLGLGGAREVLSASRGTLVSSLSKETQRNMKFNIGGSSRTVGQYLEANSSSLNSSFQAKVASVYSDTKSGQRPEYSSPASRLPVTSVAQSETPAGNSTPPLAPSPLKTEQVSLTTPTKQQAPLPAQPRSSEKTASSSGQHLPQDVVYVRGVPITSTPVKKV